MHRLNRYARDGSILSLMPNPFTKVDLSPLTTRLQPPKPAPISGSLGNRPGPSNPPGSKP